MAGAGYRLFATGEVLTAAQVNTYLQEQTVMSFADAAARTSALSGVLAEGMMSYLRDTNAVQVYNGSSWVAVGSSSPLTTKGDLYGFNSADARIPIGTNNQVLTADSTQALGLKWASPTATADSFTQIGSTTTLTGASSFTISGISGINTLFVQCFNVASSSASGFQWFIRPNNNSTGSNYQYANLNMLTSTTYSRNNIQMSNANGTSMIEFGSGGTSESGAGAVTLFGCAGTGVKVFSSIGGKTSAQDQYVLINQGFYIDSNPITSITILTGGGSNFTGGTFKVFGA